MAYISSFIYCDSIQTDITPQGPKAQIVNPLQVLAPIAVPGNYSFSVACNLAGFNSNVENTVRLQFVSPSEQVVYDTNDISFKIPVEQLQAGKPAAMQFNMDLRNLVFREVGLYSTRVFFNRELISEYKIEVIVGV